MSARLTSEQPAGDTSQPPRVLWRMQGPTRIVTAALFDTTPGVELRVFFGSDDSADLLSRQLEEHAHRVGRLERRAERLRRALREQGWVDLELPLSSPTASTQSVKRLSRNSRVLMHGAWSLGLVTLAGWVWRRRRKSTSPEQQ